MNDPLRVLPAFIPSQSGIPIVALAHASRASCLSFIIASRRCELHYSPGTSDRHWVLRERLAVEYFCRRSFNQGVSNSFAELRSQDGRAGLSRQLVRMMRQIRSRFHLRSVPYPLARMAEATQRGYRFHQQECRRDPALREWVQRDNYFKEMGHISAQVQQGAPNVPKT